MQILEGQRSEQTFSCGTEEAAARCGCVLTYVAQDVSVEGAAVSVDVPQPDGVVRGTGYEGARGELHFTSFSSLRTHLQETQRRQGNLYYTLSTR